MPRGQLTPEQRERQRAALRARNWRPASGMPAAGAGWGGTAKGDGKGGAHAPQVGMKKRNRGPNAADASGAITTGTAGDMARKARTPEAEARRERRIASAEELKVNLSEIALNGEYESNRLNATVHLLDRIEGKPTQRIDANIRRSPTDFSDAELAAIAGEGGGESGVDEEESGEK